MSNPFRNHQNTERSNLFNNQADNLEKAPLNPYQNELEGIVGYEDGSVLIDASQRHIGKPSKRQVFNQILSHSARYNKTVILDDTDRAFTNVFVKELLQDEYVGDRNIRTVMNILEVEQGSNFRFHVGDLPDEVGDHKFFRLLVKDMFNVNNIQPMHDIICNEDIDLVLSYISDDIMPHSDNGWISEHLDFLEECIGGSDIPIVAVLGYLGIGREQSESVKVIMSTVFDREEEDRIVVSCEKPSTPIFDPFYLYLDGTFVYEKDATNPEIMNSIGKEIIHPEE